jgi:hypothetical protein
MITQDEIEDSLESISFTKPKTLSQMKAWHHHINCEKIKTSYGDVFRLLGINDSKIMKYSNKLREGFTKKEELEFTSYVAYHSFEIRFVLSYIKKSEENKEEVQTTNLRL